MTSVLHVSLTDSRAVCALGRKVSSGLLTEASPNMRTNCIIAEYAREKRVEMLAMENGNADELDNGTLHRKVSPDN